MIKTIHVISDSNIGGAGRYLLTYLRNCDTKQFDVSVAVPENSLLIPEIEALGFAHYEIKGLAEATFSREALKDLKKLFRKEKPDLVHTHACLSARIAARLTGVKTIVYTRHSVFAPDKHLTTPWAKFMHRLADKFLSTGIIAVAEAAKKNVTDTGISPDKVKVIYNGIDAPAVLSEDEKAEVRKQLGIPEGVPVISIIARLTAVKGHRYFIEAAEILKMMGVKAAFVIAGTGEEEQALKKYAEEKFLGDTVIFAGFLEKVYELENVTDIQVNASYGTEAASLSLLEGMSLGIPAVVSDFGGNPELITSGVNGYVVPQKSAQAIAEHVYRLLSDKKLYGEISKCSKMIFEQKFTAAIMTKNMEDYYLSLINKKEGGEVNG